MSRWTLAIDYGTTHTAAAVALVGGTPEMLDIEGRWRLPSLVVVDESGAIHTGRAAQNLFFLDCRKGERTPKRYLGVLDRLLIDVPVVEAVAAVLSRVAESARAWAGTRHLAEGPSQVVITHPVRWADQHVDALRKAADLAGLPEPAFLPEPVAAALHFAARHQVEPGARVAVYDLGGGTFDTVVLAANISGFEIAGMPGGDPDIGGERFDDALFRLVGERVADWDADLWDRLEKPGDDRGDVRDAFALRAAVREAKEELSNAAKAHVHIAALDRSVQVTREEFEQLISGDVAETVEETSSTISSAGTAPEDLAALYLTGDSSRIPAIYRALHQHFAPLTPTTYDDPKAVVALGAARFTRLAGVSGTGSERAAHHAARCAALCREVGLDDAAQEVEARARHANRPVTSVVVVGETKRGKSSLVNALVGRAGLVPVDADVATSVYLEVVHASPPAAWVFTEDDPEGRAIDFDAVARFATVSGEAERAQEGSAEIVTSVRVGVDSPLLARGLTIVDTPGVGGLDAGHKRITLSTLSLADALIMVVDATAPLTRGELRFLADAAGRVDVVLLALTKIDAHPDYGAILDENRALLAEHAPRFADCPFLPVSSTLKIDADTLAAKGKAALAGRVLTESGFLELEEVIVSDVVERTTGLREASLYRSLAAVVARVRAGEATRLRSLVADPLLEQDLASEERCSAQLTRHGAEWRKQLRDDFSELERRLGRVVADGLADVVAGVESTLGSDGGGGGAAVAAAGLHLADGLSGYWLDVRRTAEAGFRRIIARVEERLAAGGFAVDMSLVDISDEDDDFGVARTSERLEELGRTAELIRAGAAAEVERGELRRRLVDIARQISPQVGDALHDRLFKRQQYQAAMGQTIAEARRFVERSAEQAEAEMRRRIVDQCRDIREWVEDTVRDRVEDHRAALSDRLRDARRLASLPEAEREAARRHCEDRIARADQLIEEFDTTQADLAGR